MSFMVVIYKFSEKLGDFVPFIKEPAQPSRTLAEDRAKELQAHFDREDLPNLAFAEEIDHV